MEEEGWEYNKTGGGGVQPVSGAWQGLRAERATADNSIARVGPAVGDNPSHP